VQSRRITEINKARTLPTGVVALKRLYNSYRIHAIKDNRTFDLTLEQFALLTKGNCYYCGKAPARVANKWTSTGEAVGDYTYNGIDRKDNDKGYTNNNAVSCCWYCNNCKHTLSETEYIEHCRRVALQHPLSSDDRVNTEVVAVNL
jgi:hypothetical protein